MWKRKLWSLSTIVAFLPDGGFGELLPVPVVGHNAVHCG
jgi:hypothetical protein